MSDPKMQTISHRDMPRKLMEQIAKLAAKRKTTKKALIIEGLRLLLRLDRANEWPL